MEKDLASSTDSLKHLNLKNALSIINNEESVAVNANDKSNLTEIDESLGILPYDLNSTSVMEKDLASSTESLKRLNIKNTLSVINNEESVAVNANDESNLTETDESLGILPDLLKDLTDLDFLSFDEEDKEKNSLPVARSTFFWREESNFREDQFTFNAASDAFCFENNVKYSASDFDSPTFDEDLLIYVSTPKHELANDIFEGTISGSPAIENSDDSTISKNKENGIGLSEPLNVVAEPFIDFNRTIVLPKEISNLETIPTSKRETELKENRFLNLNETKNLSQSEDYEIKYADWSSEFQLKCSDTLNLNKTQTLKTNPDNSNPIAPNALLEKLPNQTSDKRGIMQSELEALCTLDSTKIMLQDLDYTFLKVEKPALKRTSLIGSKKSFNLKQSSKTTSSNLLEPMNLNKTVKKSISLPPENKILQFQGHHSQKNSKNASSNAHVLNSNRCLPAVKLKKGGITDLKNESKSTLRRASLSGVENKVKRGVNLNSTITLSSTTTTRSLNSENLNETKASLKAFASNNSREKKPNTLKIKPPAALNSTVSNSSRRSSFGNSEKCLPLSLTTDRKNNSISKVTGKEIINLANGRMKLANEHADKDLKALLNTDIKVNKNKPKDSKTFEAADVISCNSTFSSDELKSIVTEDSSKVCKKRNSTSGLKIRNSVEKSRFPAAKKEILNKSITNNSIEDLQNKECNSVRKTKSSDFSVIGLKTKGVDKKNKNSDCCIDSNKKASLHPKDPSSILSRSSQRKSFANNKIFKSRNPEALDMKPLNTLPVAKSTKLVQDENDATFFISEVNSLEECDAAKMNSANEHGDIAKSNNLDKEENDQHKTGAIPKLLKLRKSCTGKVVSGVPGPSRGLPKLSTNLDGIKKIGHVISGKLKSPRKVLKKKQLF